MADEASFNLSAAISLQLAQGAGASLKADVAKIKGIEVPVRFKDVSATEQQKLLEKAVKPIPIKVKYDRDSVRANLTEAKLLEMMTVAQKNIVIPIKVKWDKDTAAKLKSVQSDIEKLTKYAEKLKKVAGVNNVNTGVAAPITAGGKAAKAAIDDVDDLIASMKRLATQSRSIKFGGQRGTSNFFTQSEKQIDRLKTKLDAVTSGKGLDQLKKKFEGLKDGNAANNLLNSLQTLYRGLSELTVRQNEANAAAKQFGKSFDLKAATAEIEKGKKALVSLFDTMSSSNPTTFANDIALASGSVSKNIRQSIGAASKDLRAFDSLLSSLNQKKAIAKDAKNPESVKQIDALIKEVKAQYRAGGTTVSEIKSSARVQQLTALVGNLKYIEQGAKRAEIAMDNLTRKVGKELKNSKGGQLLDLDTNAKRIGKNAGIAIGKTTDSKEIAKIVDGAKNEYSELAQRAEKANKQFGRLEAQIVKFEESDFTNAANSLKNYRAELDKLILAGTSIADIDNSVTRELAKAANLQGLDTKVNTALKQIDRLKNALNFSPVEDLSGAKPALEQLESNLKSRTGKFAALTPDSLNTETTKGLFDIRGMQRFNETADTTRTKLNNISDGFEDLSKVNVYSKYIRKFESGSRVIANSSDAVGVKLQKLRALSDKVLIGAKLDSEGGFFGAIARSAGLATKRLAAFLILAQGLYGLQSVFSSTVSEAIKVDREFTKLEQVFNKGLSGNALKDQLKETKDQITDLAKTLGISTLEVAKSAQVLAQAGIEGRDLKILLDTISSSQLGPSFGDASETAEASIAIFRQFNLTAEGTKKALGGINQLSAQYAVEAKGITEAVRRAGGVFAASGDGIESFSAAFTLVKQKTREADESIATGLRNVAQRLQTSSVQKKLKEALGVNLIDNGEFVGFEESITRIGTALKGVSKQSSLFANVREIIGGQRQGGRVNPLLEDFGEFEKLKKAFRDGADSIEKDAEVAFTSIENKLARAKAAFEQLIIEIQGSAFVKFLVEGFTQITQSVSNMLRVLNSVPGAIIAIGLAAKALGQGKIIQQAFLSNIIPRQSALKNKGGPIGLNGGGLSGIIPGGGPNKDSILAYLTTGEYVLKRKAVKKYGRTFLDNLNEGSINANKGGLIPGFAKGGPVDDLPYGSALDDLLDPIKPLFKSMANVLKSGIKSLGDMFKAANSVPELIKSSTLNLPSIKNNTLPPLTKEQKAANRADRDAEAAFEKEFIRFDPPTKKAIKKQGTGIDRTSFEESKRKQEANLKAVSINRPVIRASPEVLDERARDPKGGRYQSGGRAANPPVGLGGGIRALHSLLKSGGINIDQKTLQNDVKTFVTGDLRTADNRKANGYASARRQEIGIRDINAPGAGKTAAHELAHILETKLDKVKVRAMLTNLPKELKDKTRQRLVDSKGGYGKEGSVQFNEKFYKELFADAVGDLGSTSSNPNAIANKNPKNLGFIQLEKALNSLGVTITKTDNAIASAPVAVAPAPVVSKTPAPQLSDFAKAEQLKAAKLAKAGTAPVLAKQGGIKSFLGSSSIVDSIKNIFKPQITSSRGNSSLAESNISRIRLREKNSLKYLTNDNFVPKSSFANKNASDYKRGLSKQLILRRTTAAGGLEAKRLLGATSNIGTKTRNFGPAGGSGSPPGGPPPGGGASGSAANAAKSLTSSTAGLSSSFAALKGNSLQLISGFFILQSVLGTVSPAMAEMVSAMAAMAVSMYALSQTGAAIGFAKNAAGAGAKSIATQKARGIAETFKAARPPVAGITDAARASAKLAADLPASIFARDARAVAQKSGTKSILANIRATDGGKTARTAAESLAAKAARNPQAAARIADAKNIGFFGNKLKGFSNFGGGAAKALGGKLTIGAIAAGAIVGGLTYFANAAEKSGKEALASAKTLEEAQDAGAKTRFAKAIQAPIKKLGASIGGALTGISIGLAVGGPFAPITAAVFGLAGAIIPLISGIVPEGMSDIIKIGSDRISKGASRIFGAISDALFIISENIKNGDINYGGAAVGFLTGGVGGAIIGSNVAGGVTGKDELARQKARDEVIFRNNATARGFADKGNKSSGFYNQNGTQRTLREPEFKNLGAAGLLTQESIKREKQRVFDENKRLGRVNPAKAEDIKFEDLSQEFQETQKQNLQGIIDTYKSLGPKNKGLLISFLQGIGLDIKDLTGQVGLEIDIAATALHSAMEKLTLFFAEIAQVVKFSSARLTTIESGFDFYSSGANQSLAPDKLFDVLKSGIDPSAVGGGAFNDAYANTNRLARQFDPRLAAAADYEIRGRRVAQNASSAIIAANPVIGTQDESQIGDFLESAFDAASGGDAELNKRFGKFLETKSAEDKKGLLDADGKIDVTKLNEFFTEFADSFELGALEEIRRLNELAKQYTTQYKTMMQERFELEAQANELRSGNVDREKLKDDIKNRAAGLTGDKLAEAEGQQARARDKKKLDLALGGVAGLQGLDPNSSADIAKLSAALLASQKRQEGAGAKALEEQGGVEGIEFGQARREAVDAKTKRDAFAQSDAGKAEQAQRDAQKANISNKAKDLEKAIISGTPEEINKAQKELDNSLKQASDFNKNTTGFANEQKLTEAEKNLAQKEKDFAAKLPPSVESQNLNDAKLKTASAQKALSDYNNSAVGKQDNTDVQEAKDEVKKAEKELEAAKIRAQRANGGPNQERADKTVASSQEALDIRNKTLALVTNRTGQRRNPLTDSINNAILNEQGAQTAFDNTLGAAAGTASGAVQRQAEIEAQEAENQRRIKAGLAVAQSTDLAAHALKEFERAMDKMARSSEFLTNALLGTDEQLMSTVRGSVALGSVENAFQQGGTKAARAQFLSLNEEDRAGIQQRLGSDPDAKARFQEMLGFAPGGGAATPQQTAAEEAIQKQIDASEGLATALDANAKTLITNMENMKTLFDSQFTNAQTIVSQADKTAKELVDKIAALPGVIRHEANLTVNIIGADQMVLLQNGLREMMDKLIAQAINVNNNAIAGVNAGMNVP